MEYKKIISLTGIYDDAPGRYNANNQIKFKTVMLKSHLCDYSMCLYLLKKLQQFLDNQQLLLMQRND